MQSTGVGIRFARAPRDKAIQRGIMQITGWNPSLGRHRLVRIYVDSSRDICALAVNAHFRSIRSFVRTFRGSYLRSAFNTRLSMLITKRGTRAHTFAADISSVATR